MSTQVFRVCRFPPSSFVVCVCVCMQIHSHYSVKVNIDVDAMWTELIIFGDSAQHGAVQCHQPNAAKACELIVYAIECVLTGTIDSLVCSFLSGFCRPIECVVIGAYKSKNIRNATRPHSTPNTRVFTNLRVISVNRNSRPSQWSQRIAASRNNSPPTAMQWQHIVHITCHNFVFELVQLLHPSACNIRAGLVRSRMEGACVQLRTQTSERNECACELCAELPPCIQPVGINCISCVEKCSLLCGNSHILGVRKVSGS